MDSRSGLGAGLLAGMLASVTGCQLLARVTGQTSELATDDSAPLGAESASLKILDQASTDLTMPLGSFVVTWRGAASGRGVIKITNSLHGDDPVWATIPGRTFIEAGLGEAKIHEKRGSFRISDHRSLTCSQQVIEAWKATASEITFHGGFEDKDCKLRWSLRLRPIDAERLGFAAAVSGAREPKDARIFLRYASRPEEHFYGFGMQFSELDMKGRLLPILTQEQGVGRGAHPLTAAVELLYGKGVAGNWWTSYGSVPHYMSSDFRSLYLDTSEFSVMDMRHPSEVRVAIMSDKLSGAVLAGRSYADLIDVYTRHSGRMQPLPPWIDQGAIIGVQGGTDRVRSVYRALKESGVAISALWIQDWVGRRKTSFGSQLWWNWELDQTAYPGWQDMVSELAKDGVRILTYVNPFLVDVTEKEHYKRSLFAEAEKAGYLVKKSDGKSYLIENTSFSSGLLDLSNAAARRWMVDVIKDQVIKVGASGWMADFGEALPFDAVLASGSPMTAHNTYPEVWAQLNRQALEEAGRWQDSVIFSRSAYTQSPGKTRLFWLGDQLVTWDDRDGIKTALMGLLSSGLSGFSLNHSDTGGYTTVDNPLLKYHRSPELLQRWTELNAFTAVLRSHEGNIPSVNAQVYDAGLRPHFARFSQVYRVLTPYRRELMAHAAKSGMPLVRPLFLLYPNDPKAYEFTSEFLLGTQLLVAPVLDEGKESVDVYLPEDGWVHAASGKVFKQGTYKVAAPIGNPGVFYHPRGLGADQWMGDLQKILASPIEALKK